MCPKLLFKRAMKIDARSYHWFADVPAKKHDRIYALPKTTVHGEPSVKYRGLFINDEEPSTTL
jgi:hypothetical protein